jgi:hypothetical protein
MLRSDEEQRSSVVSRSDFVRMSRDSTRIISPAVKMRVIPPLPRVSGGSVCVHSSADSSPEIAETKKIANKFTFSDSDILEAPVRTLDTVSLDSPVVASITSPVAIAPIDLNHNQVTRDTIGIIFVRLCIAVVAALAFLCVITGSPDSGDGVITIRSCTDGALKTSETLSKTERERCRAVGLVAQLGFTLLDNFICVIAYLDRVIIKHPGRVSYPTAAVFIAISSCVMESLVWVALPADSGRDVAVAFVAYVIFKSVTLTMVGSVLLCDVRESLRIAHTPFVSMRILAYILLAATSIISVLPLALASSVGTFATRTLHHIVICIHLLVYSLFIKTQI